MLQIGQKVKLLYNVVMKKLYKLFLILGFLFLATQSGFADEYKVLVLPDNIQFDSTNHLIFPDSSVIFASDTINEIKKDGRVQTVSMTEIRDELRKNTKLSLLTKNAMKEFKYNYNIPFVDFKAIANRFSTNKVLIITSQTDIQNYFLQRTVWDFLNIPGASVLNPAYKLSTYVVLIDVDKEQVLWQNTYYKKIGSVENRIVAQNFAPATEQLEKIKSYSNYFLSPSVSRMVQAKILPPPILPQNGVSPLDMQIVPISDVKQNLPREDFNIGIELKQKTFIPARQKPANYGEMVNEL